METNNNEKTKPKKPGCCTRFATSCRETGRFMYNSETKEIMGRSGNSWLKILSFYLVFYAITAAFFAICMVGFLKTLDPHIPTMQKMYSMMKDNPAVNYEPFYVGNGTTIISFDPTDNSTYSHHVAHLNTVYQEYLSMANQTNLYKMNCQINDGTNYADSCFFNMSTLNDTCTPDNEFGYPAGKPCVLLRINRVFLWDPNNTTLDKYPCTLTTDKTNPNCANSIEFNGISQFIKTPIEESYIGVSCQGESDGDSDNIRSVMFSPPGGFPAYFYPYLNQPNYKSPLVMAQFDVIEGRVSLIMCKIWTRDIVHNLMDVQGGIHIELMVSKGI